MALHNEGGYNDIPHWTITFTNEERQKRAEEAKRQEEQYADYKSKRDVEVKANEDLTMQFLSDLAGSDSGLVYKRTTKDRCGWDVYLNYKGTSVGKMYKAFSENSLIDMFGKKSGVDVAQHVMNEVCDVAGLEHVSIFDYTLNCYDNNVGIHHRNEISKAFLVRDYNKGDVK